MKCSHILKFLKKNKLDTYHVMVTTSCDTAWNLHKKDIKIALRRKGRMTFDKFCEICNSLWCNCPTNAGLTCIADAVATSIITNKHIPRCYNDVIDYLEV